MTSGKRPEAAEIMRLADAMSGAWGVDHARMRQALQEAVYTALHRPTGAELVRQGQEVRLATLNVQATLDLVRRASAEMRRLHDELARAEARIAMLEDPAPLAAAHGHQAANDNARAAA